MRIWLWVQRLARWVLGAVFLYAGIMKMVDPVQFAEEIANYKFGPWWVVHPMAIVLPWIEIVTGVVLVCGIWLVECTVVLCGLLVMFCVVAGSAIYRALDIECGCFGGDSRVGWLLIARNVALFAMGVLAVVGYWQLTRQKVAGPPPADEQEPEDERSGPARRPRQAESDNAR